MINKLIITKYFGEEFKELNLEKKEEEDLLIQAIHQTCKKSVNLISVIEQETRHKNFKKLQNLNDYLRFKTDEFLLKSGKFNSNILFEDLEGYNMFFDHSLHLLNLTLTQRLDSVLKAKKVNFNTQISGSLPYCTIKIAPEQEEEIEVNINTAWKMVEKVIFSIIYKLTR
mmetsp:Transcript_21859/g.19404  ORF Transcript_21859/g.19404 Transcript_21859/m.19404 type:complete len:170 (+) Transcript_21859:332-841(+)